MSLAAMTRRCIVVVEARMEPVILVVEVNIFLLNGVICLQRSVLLLKLQAIVSNFLRNQSQLWSDRTFDFMR